MAAKKDNKPASQPAKTASQPAKTASQPAKTASQPATKVTQQTTRSTPPPPPSKTEEERRLDKINQLREEGKLTQNEAQELRQFAKEMSNDKGNLSAAEEKAFTDALNKSLTSNVKGNDPFKPPKSNDGGKGDGGKGDGGKGDGGKGDGGKGDGGKGDGGKGDGGGGGGGGGGNDTSALMKIIEQLQKDIAGLKKSNDDLNKKLDNLSEAGDGGGPGEVVDDEQDVVDDDAASSALDTPTTRSSARSTIKIPKPSERANIPYPSDAERIFMPNIDVRVKKEVNRITMSLIKSTREFLEAGIDYEGVNQVPSKPEFSGDDLLFYEPLEENQSEPSEQSLAAEVMGIISDSLKNLLSTGDPTNKENYNYIEFLNLFDLRYNANGDPVFDLNVALEDGIIEGLKAYRVTTDDVGNDIPAGEGT